MVVDDSVVMRRVLKSYFSQIGHSVVAEAGNGEQALVYYDAFKPDLVTLDITMPGADGIEILKQLITKNSELKVIIVSSITKKTTIIEALTNGAKHYILKPFTFDKIVSAVRGVFGEIEMNDVIKQAEEEVDIAIEEENAESVLNEVKNSIEAAKIFSKFIKIETTGSIGKENMDEYKKIISDVSSISPELITIDLCKVKNIEKENLKKIKELTEETLNEKKIRYVFIEPV
jgi:DNA-binding NarL/FixJ family response regulator